jgi:O-antigen/teichoic acid export membrane protein
MNSSTNFLGRVLVYAIGNLGAKLLTFFLVPVLSFFLSPAELGFYDLMLAAVGVAVPFFSLQLSDAAYRWLIMLGEEEKQRMTIITSVLVIFLIFVSVFSLISIAIGSIYNIHYSYDFTLLVCSNAVLILVQQIARGLKKTFSYSLSGTISAFFSLILSFAFLSKFGFKGLFIALFLSQIVATLYLIVMTRMWEYFKVSLFDRQLSRNMLAFSLPFIPNLVSWWIISVAGKFIIEHYISLDANGIFAISTKFASIVFLINSLFLLVLQDDTLEGASSERKIEQFGETFNVFAKIELCVLVFLSSLTPFLFNFLVAPEYQQGREFLSVLYLASAFSAFAAYIGLEHQRKGNTVGIAVSTVWGILICLVFTFLFIHELQLFAPAIGHC